METKLEYVYAVYKERSFVKAAEKLFVSQPSLSITIKRIEQNLGIVIFDRSRKPLELTESGKVYINYIEETMALESRLSQQLFDIEKMNAGHIKIGATNYVLSTVLPPILRAMRWQYPGIRIELHEGNSPVLKQRVLNGDLDIAIDCYTNDTNFDSHDLLDENLMLVTHAEYGKNPELEPYVFFPERYKKGDGIRYLPVPLAQEVLKDPILSFRQGTFLNARLNSLLEEYQVQPNILCEFDQVSTCITYIEEGLGSAFLPITPFFYRYPTKSVCLFALDTPVNKRTQKIFWKKGRYMPKAIELFIAMADKSVNKVQ